MSKNTQNSSQRPKAKAVSSRKSVGERLFDEPGLLVRDNAGMPIRSRKYAERPRTRFTNLNAGGEAEKGLWVPDSTVRADLPFNTSAQLPTNTTQEEFEKKLQKRARSKYVTNTVAVPLSLIASPLENSYKTSLRCSGHLTQSNGKLTGLYCGQRWCVVCARIRTARMVAGYLPQIEAMSEKWFVTLTRPNVKAVELKDTIKAMTDRASKIHRVLKERRGLKYSSLRKLECTYNAVRRDYHPHFHFIIDSEVAARALYAEWFSRFEADGIQLSHDGNEVKKADNNSVKELFKYFTKIASGKKFDKKTGKVLDYYIHIGPMDQMFQAMRGRRVFQPSGIIKAVSEDVEPNFALPCPDDLEAHFSWMGHDWINKTTSQVLSGYVPSASIKEIASHVVMPARSRAVEVPRDEPVVCALKPAEVIDYETGEVLPYVAPPAVEVPVRFGALPATRFEEMTNHEWGPVLPRTYRAPVSCKLSVAGAGARRFIPCAPRLAPPPPPPPPPMPKEFQGSMFWDNSWKPAPVHVHVHVPVPCSHTELVLSLPTVPLRTKWRLPTKR